MRLTMRIVLIALLLNGALALRWVTSTEGPSGVACSNTCGSQAALSAPGQNGLYGACAVTGDSGSQVGTLLYNNNVLSCWTSVASDAFGLVTVPHSSWYCLCLDYTDTITNGTGSAGQTCEQTCNDRTDDFNETITVCTVPSVEPLCYSPSDLTFGYQNVSSGNTDFSCLVVLPPATTGAASLQSSRAAIWQCLCSTPALTDQLNVTSNCSAVPVVAIALVAPAPATPASPPPEPQYVPIGKQSSTPVGAIVGGAVGGAVALGVIIGLLGYWKGCWGPKSLAMAGKLGKRRGSSGDAFYDPEAKDMTASHALEQFDVAIAAAQKKLELDTVSNTQYTSTGQSTLMTTSSLPTSVADFSDIQEHFGVVAKLPLPEGDKGTGASRSNEGILSIAMDADESVPGDDVFDNTDLKDTWKIDSSQLQCKMANGKPVTLGEGGFGRVYWGVLDGVENVAVKVVNSHTAKQQARFVREIATLRACHNPNIVQFLGANIRNQQTLLVMQFMPGGDLYGKLSHDENYEYGWYNKGQEIALGIVKGLVYLHSKRIAHLDLKSPNILLSKNDEPKIADVGLGKLIAGPSTIATQNGSFMWAAPEQLNGTTCTISSDIFSLGTVLWELCTTEQPRERCLRPILVPDEAPQAIVDLIAWCHVLNPLDRPTAVQVHDAIVASIKENSAH